MTISELAPAEIEAAVELWRVAGPTDTGDDLDHHKLHELKKRTRDCRGCGDLLSKWRTHHRCQKCHKRLCKRCSGISYSTEEDPMNRYTRICPHCVDLIISDGDRIQMSFRSTSRGYLLSNAGKGRETFLTTQVAQSGTRACGFNQWCVITLLTSFFGVCTICIGRGYLFSVSPRTTVLSQQSYQERTNPTDARKAKQKQTPKKLMHHHPTTSKRPGRELSFRTSSCDTLSTNPRVRDDLRGMPFAAPSHRAGHRHNDMYQFAEPCDLSYLDAILRPKQYVLLTDAKL